MLQLDEGCLQYTHSGIPEVVRNSAVGRRDVNEVIDEPKEGTLSEGRTWSRRSSCEVGSHGNVLKMHERCKVITSHECKLSTMLSREQHLRNERFNASAKTSNAAGQEDSRKQICWSDNKAFSQSS